MKTSVPPNIDDDIWNVYMMLMVMNRHHSQQGKEKRKGGNVKWFDSKAKMSGICQKGWQCFKIQDTMLINFETQLNISPKGKV